MHQAAAVSLGLYRKKKGWPTKNKTMLLAAFLHTTAAILGLLDSQDDNSQEEQEQITYIQRRFLLEKVQDNE